MDKYREGESFGNYAVTAPIGVGGMGAVYRAVHPEIGKVVAIKVLRPEIAGDDRAVARFFDEARAVNAIRHEGIVDIFDLGRRADGTVYLVMEYLAGEDLGHLLDREARLLPARAVDLINQVCESVGAAHRRGIIHRDLKPQNLFVVHRGGEERVKVLDFGIAKLLYDSAVRPSTNTGVVLGTVQYMSPEQATAQPIDARTDIYSIGCILYELLTGALPFEATTVFEAIAARASRQPAPPSQRAPEARIPPELDEIVLRALARDPAERYSETEELSAALKTLDLRDLRASDGWALADALAVTAAAAPAGPARAPGTPGPGRAPGLPALPGLPGLPGLAAAAGAPGAGAPPRQVTPSADGRADARADASGAATSAPPRQVTPPGATPRPATPRPARSSVSPRRAPAGPARLPPLDESADTELLRSRPPPLIDAESERRVIFVVIPILVSLVLAGGALYLLPEALSHVDHETLRLWLPVFGLDVAAMAALMFLVVRTQQNSNKRWVVNRCMTLLAVASISVSLHLKGTVTSYDILYYPLIVIIDRLRENRSLAQMTVAASIASYLLVVLLGHFGVVAYAPLYPDKVSPDVIADWGIIGLEMFVVALITVISYVLIDFLGTRVQRREQELRELGLGLAGRIEEQLRLLRRSERLRSYVSPQLAEAILSGEAQGVAGHERRRLTLARIDCPAIAQAAESVDAEEFAQLLNEFFGLLADLAGARGGTVDRFWGAEITVLFGAPDSAGAVADAREAARFAMAALPAIRGLSRQCEVAGVEEPPVGRAVLHTGFATVGSFGSPSRLAYTAVGPIMEATTEMLAEAPPDAVLVSHATFVLLREEAQAEPAGERVLPGAHHAVKLYALRDLTAPAEA